MSDLLETQYLNEFKIINFLGYGSFGKVYQAFNTKTQK